MLFTMEFHSMRKLPELYCQMTLHAKLILDRMDKAMLETVDVDDGRLVGVMLPVKVFIGGVPMVHRNFTLREAMTHNSCKF